MKKTHLSALLIASVVVILISGCSLFGSKDKKFARKVIDALYSGSLSSIQESLGPKMQHPMVGQMMAAMGPMLRQQFGEVKSLKLKSSETPPGTTNMTQKVWTVTAEKGTFDLVMMVNKDGKLEGVWAAPLFGESSPPPR